MLETGNPFPNFALPNQDGRMVSLSDYAGKWLVVYFYPKDDTPGCTIQGKSFTATKARTMSHRTRTSATSSPSKLNFWPTPKRS
jgi:peroxiredoxin